MKAIELIHLLGAVNPNLIVYGVEGIHPMDKFIYLVDKEGNTLVKRNEQ